MSATNGGAALPALLELAEHHQWVLWKEVVREGKLTKAPYQPTGAFAKSTDPATWVGYDDARRAVASGRWRGIGFAFSPNDPYAGVDLDGCRDPETGRIAEWARIVIDSLASYTEISPSGTGVKVFVRGRLAGEGRKKNLPDVEWITSKAPAIEMYDTKRYFTVTGEHLDGTPTTIEERTPQLAGLHARLFSPQPAPAAPRSRASSPAALADQELLRIAFNARNGPDVRALWDGSTAGYGGDDSAADCALVAHLAFYTGDDPARLDRLFRQSGLYREKWEREDYRQRTLAKAVTGLGATYARHDHGGDFMARTLAEHGAVDEGIARSHTSEARQDAMPFPLEALPAAFRLFVQEGAASLVIPPDYLAVPLLVLAGAAAGGAVELEVKPDWREGPNVYAAIIGDPGSKKSPALDRAARPMYRVQRRLKQTYDQQMARYEAELADWEAAPKRERGPKPRPPVFQHVITTDATTEALASMFQTAKGLVLIKDELVGWVKSMDQYRGGKGADRQHFLSFWSRTPAKVDRKGAPPIFVSRPCLSVVGGIQPELLSDLADAAKREDGFLDRLLWSYPEPVADHWSEAEIQLATVQTVELTFERLHSITGGVDENGTTEPRVVTLSPAARLLWREWYAEHVQEIEDPTFPRRLRGPWAKLPAQLARITLILHVLSDPSCESVADTTLAAAADVVEYFKAHAGRVYEHLGHQQRDLATTILVALKEAGEPLKQSDFLHGVFKRNVAADRIREVLERLEADGLVTRAEEHLPGRPPATLWSRA